MNNPIYIINGTERRQLKKELSELKSYAKNFWRHHQLEVDMNMFLGTGGYVLSEDAVNAKIDRVNHLIRTIEKNLANKITTEASKSFIPDKV